MGVSNIEKIENPPIAWDTCIHKWNIENSILCYTGLEIFQAIWNIRIGENKNISRTLLD